jgi:hypothetical protein
VPPPLLSPPCVPTILVAAGVFIATVAAHDDDVMACRNERGGGIVTFTRSELSDSPWCEPNTSLRVWVEKVRSFLGPKFFATFLLIQPT